MRYWVISYDLRAPGRNYEAMYALLRSWRAVRALQSVWFIASANGAITIRDALKTKMDPNDGVLVIEVTQAADWASFRLLPGAREWLQRHVP